ncbi:MAG: STAS domain-containing protein [Candidatus Wallbacteria bacterium]|nr:STAS domain-containing protein [Candidatus Wallbacteria bacterium]
MNASVVEESGQTIVQLSDDIVTENVEEFKRLMDTVLERRPGVPVVLDLGRLDYLCSAGVGIIAGAHRILKANQTELIVKDPSERVSRLFMVTRLDTVLRVIGAPRPKTSPR